MDGLFIAGAKRESVVRQHMTGAKWVCPPHFLRRYLRLVELDDHKKVPSFSLTSAATLRHNLLAREDVHATRSRAADDV
jgi:hypothetical protein